MPAPVTDVEQADPTVSAVVELYPPAEFLESESDAGAYQRETAKVKAHFTASGFEVHAPFTSNFSIGAKVSQFEAYFGKGVKLEDDGLFTSVTVEGGGRELDLDALPEDARAIVKSVFFMPPPDFVPRG